METASKRAATRFAQFLGASACALVLTAGTAGTAGAQELSADLVGSARACLNNPNDPSSGPLLAEGAAICSAELRKRPGEVRFGAETARAMPGNAIAFAPQGKAGCVNAGAVSPDPVTYNCTRPASDPLYSQCVVEIGVATGDGNSSLNEAACLLRRPITFQVRDRAGVVKFTQSANVVECLADPAARAGRRHERLAGAGHAERHDPRRAERDLAVHGDPPRVAVLGGQAACYL